MFRISIEMNIPQKSIKPTVIAALAERRERIEELEADISAAFSRGFAAGKFVMERRRA